MEDQSHQHPTTTTNTTKSPSSSSSTQPASGSAEPARSRWTPKPEQILILESIFNSGTVNPSKDDAIRIRRLLEKLGPVGDANVFYWFQNRRSRSRRRQRELQASSNSLHPPPPSPGGGGGGLQYTSSCTPPYANLGLLNNNNNKISLAGGGGDCQLAPSSSSCVGGYGSPAGGGGGGDVFWNPPIPLSDVHNPIFAFHNRYPQPPSGDGGMISVFVNGVATQVPAGLFDVKAVFGEDVILVHSTGAPVPVDDFGFCFYGLLHGETYFLVPRVA